MVLISTIVTGENAFRDFQTLLFTIDQYHVDANIFVYSDTQTAPKIQALPTKSQLHVRPALDGYGQYSRKDMEALPGKIYSSLWHDCMIEKTNVMRWVFETVENADMEGVWFLDADICLFSTLPRFSLTDRLALSPHYIRSGDEKRFGRYNGGFVWLKDPALLDVWKGATHTSRFFEQAALEELVKEVEPKQFVEIPIQHNFGWWRLDQSVDPPPVIQKRLGYKREMSSVGLTFDSLTLSSIHTHWYEPSLFNQWIRGALEIVGRSHLPAKAFLAHLKKLYAKSK